MTNEEIEALAKFLNESAEDPEFGDSHYSDAAAQLRRIPELIEEVNRQRAVKYQMRVDRDRARNEVERLRAENSAVRRVMKLQSDTNEGLARCLEQAMEEVQLLRQRCV